MDTSKMVKELFDKIGKQLEEKITKISEAKVKELQKLKKSGLSGKELEAATTERVQEYEEELKELFARETRRFEKE